MDWIESLINNEDIFPVDKGIMFFLLLFHIYLDPLYKARALTQGLAAMMVLVLFTLFVISEIPFPKSFLPTAKKILTRLFRVFVHIYMHHFERLQYLKVVSTLYSTLLSFDQLALRWLMIAQWYGLESSF